MLDDVAVCALCGFGSQRALSPKCDAHALWAANLSRHRAPKPIKFSEIVHKALLCDCAAELTHLLGVTRTTPGDARRATLSVSRWRSIWRYSALGEQHLAIVVAIEVMIDMASVVALGEQHLAIVVARWRAWWRCPKGDAERCANAYRSDRRW